MPNESRIILNCNFSILNPEAIMQSYDFKLFCGQSYKALYDRNLWL